MDGLTAKSALRRVLWVCIYAFISNLLLFIGRFTNIRLVFYTTADTYKGSFYANPQYDNPTADPKLMELYPQDYHPNLWPEELPELQTAFKALGPLMVEVGCHIARHCDKYVRSKLGDAYKPANLLESIISNSRVAKVGSFVNCL